MSAGSSVPGGLSISSVREGSTVRIVLEGEMDLASAQAVEDRLRAAEADSPKRVVIDLAQLAFIDSTGLRLLLQADARARQQGCELVLRPGEASVQRVFEITGALDVLRFEDTSEGQSDAV
ncbi:MAG: STAS domain-containing protein [Solirubrobacteraceae bacterium]